MKNDHILVGLLGILLIGIGMGGYGCPPNPVVPDGGAGFPGTGGTVVVDATPPPTPPPTCQKPSGSCCKTCLVLATHSCPEGRPTSNGVTCEAVCLNASTGPLEMRWADVSACTELDCVHQRFECLGGM